jgi:hypothetical protein
MRGAQGLDQRLRRAHLADRHRMNPQRVRHRRRAERQPLIPVPPVAALAPAAPQQAQRNQRRGQQQGQPVEGPVENQARSIAGLGIAGL